MKVLAIASEFDRCESNMLANLARSGIEVVAAIEPKQRFGEVLTNAQIPIHPLTCKGRIDPKAIMTLKRILRNGKFDIVHAFSGRGLSNMLIASYGLPVKRVAYRGTMGHLSRWDPTSWLSYLNPGLHKIICVSHAVEGYLREIGVADKKIVTIHKGHNVSWYDGDSNVQLTEFGVPEGAFVVGCVANMRPVKGVDVLVKAMDYLPTPSPIHLLLVGEVRDEKISNLINSSKLKDQIHLTGFRADAPSIVARCNAFVMPSIKREGLPKALIEAMIKSVPPIVSRVGGMPEIVREGTEGLVIPPSDPRAIADAIVKLFSDRDLCAQFAKASRQRIETSFNIEDTTAKTLTVYQQLLQ